MIDHIQFQNGKLKIMQITDAHEGAKPHADTLKLISRAVETEKPDLVLFTGDQISGYSPFFRIGNRKAKVEKAMRTLVNAAAKHNVPFAVTFGNHDPQTGLTDQEQMAVYESFPQSTVRHDVGPECGTYRIPIYSSDGKSLTFNLYVIDSHGKENGAYLPVNQGQIDWFRETNQRYSGIKSILFQHIPVFEIYNLLKQVDKDTKGAVRAYRIHNNEHYILPDNPGRFLEPPSIPDENHGEFEAVAESGNVLAMFFGHDHHNTFIGRYKGVDLGYTPSCGFNEYGSSVFRGVRVIELDERDTGTYTTRIVTFKELCGTKVATPLAEFIHVHTPTTTDAALRLFIKLFGGIAVLIAVLVLLIKFL